MSENVDISLAVRALLKGSSAITDLIADRLYSDHIPQTAPSDGVVFWVVTENPWEHLGGSVGIDQARIQFDAFSRIRGAANEIAWTIWNQFDGYAGVSAGVQIKGVSRARGVSNLTDRTLLGSDQYRFIASQDLLFTYCSKQKVSI